MRKIFKKASSILFAGAIAFTTILGAAPALDVSAATMYMVTPTWSFNTAPEASSGVYTIKDGVVPSVYVGAIGDTVQVRLPDAPSGLYYCKDVDGTFTGSIFTTNKSDVSPYRYANISLPSNATIGSKETIGYSGAFCNGQCGSSGHASSQRNFSLNIVASFSGISTTVKELTFAERTAATQSVPFSLPTDVAVYNMAPKWCTITGTTATAPAGATLTLNNTTVDVAVSATTPAGVYYFMVEASNGIHSDIIKVNIGKQKASDIRVNAVLTPYTEATTDILLPALPEGISYNDQTTINLTHSNSNNIGVIKNFNGITTNEKGYVLTVNTNSVPANSVSPMTDTITITLSNGTYEPFNVIITAIAEKTDLSKTLVRDIYYASKYGPNNDVEKIETTNGTAILDTSVFPDSKDADKLKEFITSDTIQFTYSGRTAQGTMSVSNLSAAIANAAPQGNTPVVYDISWINGPSVLDRFAKTQISNTSSATYGDKYILPTTCTSKLHVYATGGIYKYEDIPSTELNKSVYTGNPNRSVSYTFRAYSTSNFDANLTVSWYIDNVLASSLNNANFRGTNTLTFTISDAALLGVGTHKVNCVVSSTDFTGVSVASAVATLNVVNGSGSDTNTSIPISGNNSIKVNVNVSGDTARVDNITAEMINSLIASNSTNTAVSLDLSNTGKPVSNVILTSTSVSNISSALTNTANKLTSLEIKMSNANMILDAASVAAIYSQASNNDVTFGVAPKALNTLTTTQQSLINSMSIVNIYDAYVAAGANKITNLSGGKATVSFKNITVASGRNRDYFHVIYIPQQGSIERMTTTFKDSIVTATLTHFSDYAIIYDQNSRNANENSTGAGTVYRLFKLSTGEHLYTTDANEVATLTTLYGWEKESSPGNSADSNGIAVYRLFNPATGEHLYTPDVNECKTLTTSYGWSYDNNAKPMFYGSATSTSKAVYRVFNGTLPAIASHHYTSDLNEITQLVTNYKYTYDNKGKPMYYLL